MVRYLSVPDAARSKARMPWTIRTQGLWIRTSLEVQKYESRTENNEHIYPTSK
jgi:hypothetical protein